MWTGKGKPLRAADYAVRDLDIAVGERLVQRHHYAAGASNTAVYLHGLFPADAFWEQDAQGAAWWIPPTKGAAKALTEDWGGVLALSRLVIEPGVPGNAATFLMASSMRAIDRRRWPVFVTYADSWRGHTGAIYKATGWTESGQTSPEATYTLNGRMIARKAGGQTRTHAQMLTMGCVFEGRHAKTRYVHRGS